MSMGRLALVTGEKVIVVSPSLPPALHPASTSADANAAAPIARPRVVRCDFM